MNKLISLLALGVVASSGAALAASDPVSDAYDRWTLYSDETIACVAEDAETRLSPGQYEYLVALLDGEAFNATEARRDSGISLGEAIQVHGFLATDATRCRFDN